MTYNAAGQALTRTGNAAYDWPQPSISATGYSANGRNQYTAVSGANFTYDTRGNLTSTGSASFGYDAFNRLTNAGTASLSYDPAGRLYQTQLGVATTRFLYDGLDAIAEYDGSGNMLHRYVHGPSFDEPIVQYEGSGTSDRRWLVADQLGSVLAATNAAGEMVGAPNTYDEYGQPGASNAGRFQYTGQMWLAEAGVYHYKARAYAPVIGRFLQTDPILYGGGMNLYVYVGNDPVNLLDPLGLQRIFPEGEGPIVRTETITVTGQRPPPCPRGWRCSAVCPRTENCFADPFGGPAFGSTGANTLPNAEREAYPYMVRLRRRRGSVHQATTEWVPCPVISLQGSLGLQGALSAQGGPPSANAGLSGALDLGTQRVTWDILNMDVITSVTAGATGEATGQLGPYSGVFGGTYGAEYITDVNLNGPPPNQQQHFRGEWGRPFSGISLGLAAIAGFEFRMGSEMAPPGEGC